MTDFLAPGTRVAYAGTGQNEYGIVVHCWMNVDIGAYDCYVAFFGESMPEGAPTEKPYVLRYFASSLSKLQ